MTSSLFDRLSAQAVALVAFAIGAFHLVSVSGLVALSTRDIRIFHLLMMLTLLFLTTPTLKRLERSPADRLFRLVLTGVTVASCGYLMTRWLDIAMSGGETEPLDAWIGLMVLALILEGARRAVGKVLALICLVFFTYPFYSPYLPGVLGGRGYSLERVSEFLTTTSQGVFGVPLGVSASYIILFAIYGAFLSAFGAGDFFFRIATRLTRGMRAAGAKTAVIFSTLLGMISGSAAGNVAVTGTLTIPMMKREGYKSEQAGAIEAVVSTGGQLMPPVMGAGAFIMAEIVGRPYAEIMQAAMVPALLFFMSVFFMVHLQAVKADLKPLTLEDDLSESTWMILLRGSRFIISFGVLIAMMLNGFSPFKASFYSLIALVVLHVATTRRIDLELIRNVASAIAEGAKSVIPIAAACAAAGIIAGILSFTGLGSKISGLIVTASGGVPFFALLLTMVAAIILGMGLPTTAAYLILATVVAPALSEIGVPLLTAHMFVFFYGCVSTITPPVALASYVAAGIAKADINRVGWTAFAYGIVCYVLPFMFFFGPALLLDGSGLEIAMAAASGGLGVLAIAGFVVGQLDRRLNILSRVVLLAAGLLLLIQGLATDLAGLALAVGVVIAGRFAARRNASSA
jgi:TRAP transporter 4TM/12TM fusion protein